MCQIHPQPLFMFKEQQMQAEISILLHEFMAFPKCKSILGVNVPMRGSCNGMLTAESLFCFALWIAGKKKPNACTYEQITVRLHSSVKCPTF